MGIDAAGLPVSIGSACDADIARRELQRAGAYEQASLSATTLRAYVAQ